MSKQKTFCSFVNEHRNGFDCEQCEYTQGINLVRINQRKYIAVPYVIKDGVKHYSCPHGREAI